MYGEDIQGPLSNEEDLKLKEEVSMVITDPLAHYFSRCADINEYVDNKIEELGNLLRDLAEEEPDTVN